MDTMERIVAAWEWLMARWAVSAPPSIWVIVAIAAAVIVITAIRPTWIITRHGATIVHEMGHVTMAWLWGRRIQGIRLHTDTSGLAITEGKPRGLGVLLTFLAGYTAPPLLGLGLVAATLAGWSGAALTGVVVILGLALLLVRNFFGILTVGVAILVSVTILATGDPTVITTTTLTYGIFLLIAGVRTVFDLSAAHGNGTGTDSDAALAARHSILPTVLWIGFFYIVAFWCAVTAAIMLYTHTQA